MKSIETTATFVALLLSTVPGYAAQNDTKPLRLICEYSYTVDDKGEKSDTTGEELFTVATTNGKDVVIRKQSRDVLFFGRMSEDEISGEGSYKAGGLEFVENLRINRFTGEFQLSFGVNGKGGLIHFGYCRVAAKPLF